MGRSRVGSIGQTMAAAARTGHNMTSSDAIWVVVLFFLSFFCISKVALRQSAYLSDGLLWSMSRPFLKNQRFRRQRISIRCFSCCGTFDVLTRTHGKEEGKDCELRDCTLFLRELLLGNFGDDAGRDGFLLLLLWVFVFDDTE